MPVPLLQGNPPEHDRLLLAPDRVREVLWLTAAHYFEHCFGVALEGVLNAADVARYRGPRVPAARALLRVLDPPTPLRMGVDLN